MTDSERDLATIAAVLNEPEERPEPAPRSRSRSAGRKAAPVRVAATTDDDDDGELVDDGSDLDVIATAPVIEPPRAPVVVVLPVAMVPEKIATVPVLGPSAPLSDLPSVENVPAVVSARAAEARLADARKDLAETKAALLTTLNLSASAGERDLDKLQVKLIVAGADESQIESLRAILRREKLLVLAASDAAGATSQALQKARNELSERAAAVEFRPAARASALALLELIRCKGEELAAQNRLRAGGFAQPNGTFTAEILDPWNNTTILHLVRDGWLTREEVRAACPFMNAI
ncbi:unnamed protein product [Gemmata massiliana]|uniref:Uncharacterized protein n=1 Tax=Gemmata massiliana TaxID=1210884 RepID=A0A6P2CTG9_9BACT|nr:hypothetical protein [Gemmata massiliana]VTR91857.1 unnamed protein product [Gemmata massiliana]